MQKVPHNTNKHKPRHAQPLSSLALAKQLGVTAVPAVGHARGSAAAAGASVARDSTAGEDEGGGRRPLLLLLLQCMVLLPVASLHVLLRPGRICNNCGAAAHKLA